LYEFLKIGYDKKVAQTIKSALDIETAHGEEMIEIFRGIRLQLTNLLSGK
jgi:hypothetical protein